MKISTRLSLGIGFGILMAIIGGSFAIFQMQTMVELMNQMYHHPFTVSNVAIDIIADIDTISTL